MESFGNEFLQLDRDFSPCGQLVGVFGLVSLYTVVQWCNDAESRERGMMVDCTPDPSLLESMRSVGYSLNTAVADLIDNSIAAHAREINVCYFDSGETPYVAIVDDGDGMDYQAAVNAMKLAGTSPTDMRSSEDLGRFGLGLKTASLSQARSVLLVTTRKGSRCALRWDLDHVSRTRSWDLEELDVNQIDRELPQKVRGVLSREHGTCVIWRNLDRLETVSGHSLSEIDSAMRELADYLGLVFHRYLHPYPEDDIRQIDISINGVPVPERDPFLIKVSSASPLQRVAGTDAVLQSYTLPFQNRLTEKDKKLLDLRPTRGHTLEDTQGFYVYRAYRLITWGTWFRMLPRKDSTKLARVRVDIPNSMDDEWTLDIKKSTAYPPKMIRDAMRLYVDNLAAPSRRRQRFRGRKTGDDPQAHIWDVINDRDGVFRYQVNEKNPYVSAFIDELDEEQRHGFTRMMKVLADSLPYYDIQMRLSRDEAVSESDGLEEEIRKSAASLWQVYKLAVSQEQFISLFEDKEPFSLSRQARRILKEVSDE